MSERRVRIRRRGIIIATLSPRTFDLTTTGRTHFINLRCRQERRTRQKNDSSLAGRSLTGASKIGVRPLKEKHLNNIGFAKAVAHTLVGVCRASASYFGILMERPILPPAS